MEWMYNVIKCWDAKMFPQDGFIEISGSKQRRKDPTPALRYCSRSDKFITLIGILRSKFTFDSVRPISSSLRNTSLLGFTVTMQTPRFRSFSLPPYHTLRPGWNNRVMKNLDTCFYVFFITLAQGDFRMTLLKSAILHVQRHSVFRIKSNLNMHPCMILATRNS